MEVGTSKDGFDNAVVLHTPTAIAIRLRCSALVQVAMQLSMLVGMLQADVDINAGIIAGGFIPGMQYSPTEVPFACWLVGGGCWRWFTLAFVLIYYYLWIKVERGPAKPINKKELSAWHAEHRRTLTISCNRLRGRVLAASRRDVHITFYWHHLMFMRASVVAFIVCFFELCPDIWDSYFFAPWLRVCWYSVWIVFLLAGYMLRLGGFIVRTNWYALKVAGNAVCYLTTYMWHLVV